MQEERTNRPVSGGSESFMVCALLLLIYLCTLRLEQEPEDSVNKKIDITNPVFTFMNKRG